MIDLKERAGKAMNVPSQLGDPQPDPKVTLGALAFASDLGRHLWHLKYGQDQARPMLRRATALLADRLREPGKFNRSKFTGLTKSEHAKVRQGERVKRARVDIIERLAERAIMEWIDDLCPHCNGRGTLSANDQPRYVYEQCGKCKGARETSVAERIPFAARSDGRGPMVFRTYSRCSECAGFGHIRVRVLPGDGGNQICRVCSGSGHRQPNASGRAVALGVTLSLYRTHWQVRFDAVISLLESIDSGANETMRQQLRAK